LFLACKGKKQNDEPETSIDSTHIAPEQKIIQDDIFEESSLEFFNPIGILGIGVINILSYVESENQEYTHIDKICIYNDPECKDLLCCYTTDKAWKPPMGITPIYNSIEYGWYCFVCTGSNTNSYEVAINRTDKKYVRKDKNIKYYTWGNFFDAVFTVNPTEENPLREEPSDDAPKVNIFDDEDIGGDPEDYYQEIKLQGEWLHIKYEKSGDGGWLRWRKGNDIIANISISW